MIVVAHHPLRTGGPHGGHGRGFWRRQLVRMAGGLGIDVHDLDASAYRRMLRAAAAGLRRGSRRWSTRPATTTGSR